MELDAIRVKSLAWSLRSELPAFRWQTFGTFASNLCRVRFVTVASGPFFRQVAAFVGAGLIATSVHYAILILLVQLAAIAPVQAALCGFVIGGCLSYSLNRRHTFVSTRPHEEAAWRFMLVAGVGFALTYLSMRNLVETWRIDYRVAQVITTGLVMVWTFSANRMWTFREKA